MILASSNLETMLERHKAFWDMTQVTQPLIGASSGHPFAFDDFEWSGQEEGLLTPEMIRVTDFLSQYEQHYQAAGSSQGDIFWFGEPPRAIPWMEAIMGCPVRVSVSGRSIWPEPLLKKWTDLDNLPDYRESPWLELGLELTGGLVKQSQGRFPVAMFLQRGPIDVAAAMRGMGQLCLDVYDHPEQFQRLLALCTKANLYVAQRLAEVIPEFHGGHVNYFGVWAPGWPYLHQQDGMASFSPRLYAQTVRATDDILMGAFDFSIRKFHSSSLHILDEASHLSCVKGVQVTIDPTGPTLNDLIPTLRLVQENKPLIVNCTSQQAMQMLRERLLPRGLCLYYWETAQGRAKLSFGG